MGKRRKQREMLRKSRIDQLWHLFLVEGRSAKDIATKYHLTVARIYQILAQIKEYPDLKEKYDEIKAQQNEQKKKAKEQIQQQKCENRIDRQQQYGKKIVNFLIAKHASLREAGEFFHMAPTVVAYYQNLFLESHLEYRPILDSIKEKNRHIVKSKNHLTLIDARKFYAYIEMTAVPVRIAAIELHLPPSFFTEAKEKLQASTNQEDQILANIVLSMITNHPERAPLFSEEKEGKKKIR